MWIRCWAKKSTWKSTPETIEAVKNSSPARIISKSIFSMVSRRHKRSQGMDVFMLELITGVRHHQGGGGGNGDQAICQDAKYYMNRHAGR